MVVGQVGVVVGETWASDEHQLAGSMTDILRPLPNLTNLRLDATAITAIRAAAVSQAGRGGASVVYSAWGPLREHLRRRASRCVHD